MHQQSVKFLFYLVCLVVIFIYSLNVQNCCLLKALAVGGASKHQAISPTYFQRSCHHLKGIHSRSDTSRTGAEGLSFYYPRLLHCLNQMLAVVLLGQHRVSSSKTVRPRAPCGARCIGHAVTFRDAKILLCGSKFLFNFLFNHKTEI